MLFFNIYIYIQYIYIYILSTYIYDLLKKKRKESRRKKIEELLTKFDHIYKYMYTKYI